MQSDLAVRSYPLIAFNVAWVFIMDFRNFRTMSRWFLAISLVTIILFVTLAMIAFLKDDGATGAQLLLVGLATTTFIAGFWVKRIEVAVRALDATAGALAARWDALASDVEVLQVLDQQASEVDHVLVIRAKCRVAPFLDILSVYHSNLLMDAYLGTSDGDSYSSVDGWRSVAKWLMSQALVDDIWHAYGLRDEYSRSFQEWIGEIDNR